MGAFIVNLHVRTQNVDAVKSELEGLRLARAYLSPAHEGWVSVYEEGCSSQDPDQITSLAGQLSQGANALVMVFLVHDSDFLCYWLFDRGELLDHYNSWPDYFSEGWLDDEDAPGDYAAQTHLLVRYAREGVRRQQFDALLHQDGPSDDPSEEHVFADDRLRELASLLGIGGDFASVDFTDLGRDVDADELGLIFVGTEAPPDHSAIRSIPKPDLSDPQSAFVHAAAQNDVDRIRELAAGAVDIDAADGFYKRPALVVAVECRSIEAAKVLLELGANVDASDQHGSTALYNAVVSNNLDMLRLLISHGADPQAANVHMGAPLTLAIQYGRTECAVLLLEAGADPNRPDLDGETPLHRAVEAENVRVVDQLIQRGANVNFDNRKRKKPLQVLEERWELWADRLEEEGPSSPLARRIKGHLSRLRAIRRFLTETTRD